MAIQNDNLQNTQNPLDVVEPTTNYGSVVDANVTGVYVLEGNVGAHTLTLQELLAEQDRVDGLADHFDQRGNSFQYERYLNEGLRLREFIAMTDFSRFDEAEAAGHNQQMHAQNGNQEDGSWPPGDVRNVDIENEDFSVIKDYGDSDIEESITPDLPLDELLNEEDGWSRARAASWNKMMHASNGNTDQDPNTPGTQKIVMPKKDESFEEAKERVESPLGTEEVSLQSVIDARKKEPAPKANPEPTVKESVVSRLFEQLWTPPITLTLGNAGIDITMQHYVETGARLQNLREQDTEARVQLCGGLHWIGCDVLAISTEPCPVPMAVFVVRPIRDRKTGPRVNLNALYTTAMTLSDGGDPGAVSSPLRMALTQVYGNLNVVHSSLVGKFVRQNMGTSTADILCRALLAMCSQSAINERSEHYVSNTLFVPDTPASIVADGAVFFPYAEVRPALPMPANTITACVGTLADAVNIAAGYATPVAGFEVCHWGQVGPDGVAVVPVRQGWTTNGESMIAWAAAHMEYPGVFQHLEGDIEDVGGNTLEADCNGVIVTNRARVPGPYGKILFVLTDIQNGTPTDVALGRAGIIGNVAYANRVIGGVALDVSDAFEDWFQVDIEEEGQANYQAVTWWNLMCGNEDDWASAFLTVADLYAWWPLAPRRYQATGELLYWNNDNGDPFAQNAVGYVEPTDVLIAHMENLFSSGSCNIPTNYDAYSDVAASQTDFRIGGHDPIVYLGYAGRLYSYAEPLHSFAVSGGFNSITRALSHANTVLACGFDYMASSLGIPEQCLFSCATLNLPGSADELRHMLFSMFMSRVNEKYAACTYSPTWAGSHQARVAASYAALCPNSLDSMSVQRVPTPLIARLSGTTDLVPRDDFTTVAPLQFVVREVDQTYYDVLVKFSPTEFYNDTSLGLRARKALTTGGFTVALVDISGYVLCDLQGGNLSAMSIPFAHPTTGLAWYLQYHNVIVPSVKSGIREVLFSPLPLMIATELGNRKMHLALTGARDITASTGRALPLMVYYGGDSVIRGVPMVDADTFRPADVAGLGIFRL